MPRCPTADPHSTSTRITLLSHGMPTAPRDDHSPHRLRPSTGSCSLSPRRSGKTAARCEFRDQTACAAPVDLGCSFPASLPVLPFSGVLSGLFIHVDCPQCPFSIDMSQATSTETYNLSIALDEEGNGVAQLYAPT